MKYLSNQSNKITLLAMLVWGVASAFFLYEFFIRTFLSSLVYEISNSLSLSTEQLSLIDAAYYLTYGIMQIPVGILADIFSIKKLLTVAVILCTTGVFIFSSAHTFYVAFFARMLMGFGSSFAFISLLILTLTWLPHKFSGFFFGLAQFIGAIGPMLAGAPLVLVLYKFHDHWRLIFSAIGMAGIMLAFLVLLFVTEKRKNVEKRQIMKLTHQIILIAKSSNMWAIITYSSLIYFPIALLGTLWGTTFLGTKMISHGKAAFATSFMWLGLGIGSPLFGAISDIIERRKPIMLICAICGILSSLAIIYLPHANLAIFIMLFFLLGLAGAGQSIAFNTISEYAHPQTRATALGLNNAMISFTNIIMMPIIGLMIQSSLKSNLTFGKIIYHAHNFMPAFLVMPIFQTIALVVIIFFAKETFGKMTHKGTSP